MNLERQTNAYMVASGSKEGCVFAPLPDITDTWEMHINWAVESSYDSILERQTWKKSSCQLVKLHDESLDGKFGAWIERMPENL